MTARIGCFPNLVKVPMKKRATFVCLTWQLKMLWGKIEAVNTEVPLPHLHGNIAGAVTVELIAPQQPGTSNYVVLGRFHQLKPYPCVLLAPLRSNCWWLIVWNGCDVAKWLCFHSPLRSSFLRTLGLLRCVCCIVLYCTGFARKNYHFTCEVFIIIESSSRISNIDFWQ